MWTSSGNSYRGMRVFYTRIYNSNPDSFAKETLFMKTIYTSHCVYTVVLRIDASSRFYSRNELDQPRLPRVGNFCARLKWLWALADRFDDNTAKQTGIVFFQHLGVWSCTDLAKYLVIVGILDGLVREVSQNRMTETCLSELDDILI